MAAWRLYRHVNRDGSSKDWAVMTHPDGRITTRWGKTAVRLPGISTRNGVRQVDIEREKQAKGYVFVSEVDIDSEGMVFLPGQVMPDPPPPLVGALYWHIDCRGNPDAYMALGIEIGRLIDDIQFLPAFKFEAMTAQYWPGWQQLLDLSLNPKPFVQSGQIKPVHGVLPWLFLMALKHKLLEGGELGIATDSSREVSNDLKAEQAVLDFFGTDLDSIRGIAEIMGLLEPRLNLALVLPDTNDYWF